MFKHGNCRDLPAETWEVRSERKRTGLNLLGEEAAVDEVGSMVAFRGMKLFCLEDSDDGDHLETTS